METLKIRKWNLDDRDFKYQLGTRNEPGVIDLCAVERNNILYYPLSHPSFLLNHSHSIEVSCVHFVHS